MRRATSAAALAVALMLSAPARAERFALGTQGSAAFYAVTLSADVYAHSQRAGLADLRVRNGAGEPVPYALDMPAAPPAEARTLHEVPWFALPEPVRRESAPVGVVIGPDGALRAGASAPASGGPAAWLVDLSRLREPVAALVVGLGEAGAAKDATQDRDYRGDVDVSYSDDLRHWTPAGSAQLLRASRAGSVLSQERIELDRVRARYLKLQWRDAPPAQARVQAEIVAAQAGTVPAANLQWREGIAATQPGGAEYLFDTGGRFPAERVRVQLPQPNTVVLATLWSRPDAQAAWRPVSATKLYRLAAPAGASAAGTEQESAPLVIARNDDRYWRLTIDGGQGGLGGVPVLALGWRPATVTFVARGGPPFSLVVAEPLPRTADAGPIARADLLVGATPAIGTARILAMAASPPSPPEEDPGKRRRLTLWAALLVAVGLLGAMAWRLVRTAGKPPAAPGAQENGDASSTRESSSPPPRD